MNSAIDIEVVLFVKIATLTPVQLKIVNHVEGMRETMMDEMIRSLQLAEEELRRVLAVLRHMEIVKAMKKNDKIIYVLFWKLASVSEKT